MIHLNIYTRQKDGSREIRFPILPEEIVDESGKAVFITSEIMSKGEVATPSGTELSAWSWKSVFPGSGRKNDPLIRGLWTDPKLYDTILRDWLRNGTIVNLLVTGYQINEDVYVREYKSAYSGPFGDIAYEVVFVEARDITITTSTVEAPATTRPTTQSTSYTIKSGDTLWGIARRFYGDGTKWKVIYDANKDIIEQTAKKYGRSSSDNGHWIYPGVTITIPNASTGAGNSGSTASTGSTKAAEQEWTDRRNEGVNVMVDRINDKTPTAMPLD